MTDLIPLEEINAVEVFTEKGIDSLLNMIQQEVKDFEPDVETEKGRKECVSMAYKITLSKGVIDRAGKDLVADMKEEIKVVDGARRRAREVLSGLADEVRRPVTEYEEAEAKRKAAEKLAAEIEEAHAEALLEDKLWEQEREIERMREEERKRQEAEERRLAEEQAAKEAAEREERLRKEAQERAEQEAKEKIEAERRRAEEAEQRQKEAAERAERERQEAVEAERRRLVREQEEREAERRRIAAQEAEAERKRQADADHRKEVNRGALDALVACGFSEEDAKKFITAVYQGKIPGIRMDY